MELFEEEETFDEMLKDLRENSQQNKLMKNFRLYKNQINKSNENLANNLPEIISSRNLQQIPNIFNLNHSQIGKPMQTFQKFSNKSQIKKKDTLFESFAIIIVPNKNELSEIRRKVLREQILKRKGKIFDFAEILEDFSIFLIENQNRFKIVLSSKSSLYEVLIFFYI